ncbi:hypothetical protein GCM10017044_13470 [Kordiimonas sediminis]|uniref:(S)-ureidoglycine aminohydrolase cupin domain-containing protein n=1 Tax=Kordiimonas sediminis TaxID=1735581 RepID=A0A919AQ41_9PROT|nr:cupin domain-containing protein [Kordiimonas sediminis]GHF20000.1 hypothetical protein GCM10017044_13470 [Kordiimonas sediminis]
MKTQIRSLVCAATILGMAGTVSALSDVVKPVPMTKDQIAGNIFKDYTPVVTERETAKGKSTAYDVETFLSSDKQFDTGMYKAGPARWEIDEPYGVDEFMYFLEGSVTLTSSDGSVMTINAGDAVTIPREWTGVWETDGYVKIYVIYNSEGPIE